MKLAPGIRTFGLLFRLVPSISQMTPRQLAARQAPASPRRKAILRGITGRRHGQIAAFDRVIVGPQGDITVRVYVPETVAIGFRPVIVNFHGGGWVFGDLDGGDWLCSEVAQGADAVVVSVDYRLAPGHPFPQGLEDCYAALVWAGENAAAFGGDSHRLGVMGESAGGNLAASICLLSRERSGPTIRHQTLVYPVTDAARDTESYRANANAVILTSADMAAFLDHYVPPGIDRSDWRISPLNAPDHVGLPAAFVAVAAHDPLRDDGISYAKALEQSSVPVNLVEYSAMPHGFLNFPYFSRDAKRAMRAMTEAQRLALHS